MGLLRSYPVSPAVNSNRSDGPELVEPLAESDGDEDEGSAGARQLRLLPPG